eukprot:10589157-Alexandrium_andersonii.AAC.1
MGVAERLARSDIPVLLPYARGFREAALETARALGRRTRAVSAFKAIACSANLLKPRAARGQ